VSRPRVFDPEYLAQHCRQSVNLLGGLNAALDGEIVDEKTVWIELGPHPVCSNMIKATIGKDVTAVPSLRRNEDPWKTISSSLSSIFHVGVDLNWQEYHREFRQSHEVLSIPSYAYDDKVYWIDYRENWCLTKGEKSLAAPPPPAFTTTSVHKIVQEIVNPNTALVIGESDLSEPLLRAVIAGHSINGVGFCPSSLYADMALTICGYAHRVANPDSEPPHLNVGAMETHAPLILDLGPKGEKKILQIEGKVDFTSGEARVTYRSISQNGDVTDQAKCLVTFEDSNVWMNEWERRKYMVKGRVDALKKGGKGVHHIHRGLAYKLFAALVQYDDKYRGMEEVILSSEGLEATSQVAFQATSKDGKFVMSPYFIDSVAHITGFVMNANDSVDSSKHIYISHGWESMRFARALEADKRYTSYVKMQAVPGSKGMVAGDVYVFEGDDIIGVVGGVRFQCVPKVLLDTLTGVNARPSARSVPAKIPQQKVSQAISRTRKTQTKISTQKLQIKEKATTYTSASNVVTTQALQIIASEVGCEMSELADPIELSDLGIDSLMSLSISGRFREELDLNFSSSVFNDIPTIAGLKSFLQQFESSDTPDLSGMSTPDMASSDSGFSEDLSELSLADIDDLGVPADNDDDNDIVQIIRSTIAEEMGVEIEEISDNTDLATMGMDSLMSLSILGALREKTGLAMHSNLLVDNTCVEKIETSLGLRKQKTKKTSQHMTSVREVSTIAASQTITSLSLSSYPRAQSILLQGNPRTATHTLFLLPDGSGSATSYATIPDIAHSDLAVYGLNCPFMKTPEAFTIGVVGVTQIYMAEIQRRQPTGPYLLGGWSAGGVLAFEMTRQLLQKGEKVDKLLLIDSPCPVGLEALPSSFHRFCDSIGLLGNGDSSKIPSWLLPHFAAAVRELTAYSDDLSSIIDTIDVSRMPATTAIWARDGIVARETDPKPEWDPKVRMPNSMQWLVENRTHRLGTNGWEKLVGNNVKCMSTAGNHFTMMRAPIVSSSPSPLLPSGTNNFADA
jgi:iterative type I PKS product template protein